MLNRFALKPLALGRSLPPQGPLGPQTCFAIGLSVYGIGGLRRFSPAPEGGSVMVQPDRQEHRPAAQRETPPSRLARYTAPARARDRFEGSLVQSFLQRLKALDFASQAMLFGSGLPVSLLPFVILLSAFASQRIDDDISERLGLDRRAAGIVHHLFISAPATLSVATATSLIFLLAGMLAVASSLQQIYETVFRQDHQGLRDLYRLLTWIVVLIVVLVAESLAERPVSAVAGSGWLAPLVTVAIMAPFYWWTMHFLLAGRVRWRMLLPSAIITGVLFAGLGFFSKFYFSETIVSDSKMYGTIGAIFGIMTWFIVIGAVIILGAAAGAVWEDRRNLRPAARASPERASFWYSRGLLLDRSHDPRRNRRDRSLIRP
jgi:membrane protein